MDDDNDRCCEMIELKQLLWGIVERNEAVRLIKRVMRRKRRRMVYRLPKLAVMLLTGGSVPAICRHYGEWRVDC
jgi:hypothetical protein